MSEVEENNKTSVDALFNELDQGFVEKLQEIQTEIAQIEPPAAGLESLALSADLLKEGNSKDGVEGEVDFLTAPPVVATVAPPRAGTRPFLVSVTLFFGETLYLPFSLVASLMIEAVKHRKTPRPEQLLQLTQAVKLKIAAWQLSAKELSLYFRGINYKKLALLLLLTYGIAFLLRDIHKKLSVSEEVNDPFLASYKSVADSSEDVPGDSDTGASESILQHPEFTVKIPRIISNLKALTPKASPMATTELYLEASNQETAVEIHDREREVRDAVERVFEDSTFDSLDTLPGKENLKLRLRNSINRILNHGRVKRIYFNTLNIAP